jgi:uncharacterized protein YbaR (Trm112 family)
VSGGLEGKDAPGDDASGHDGRMLEALVCPQTRGPLTWDAKGKELVSRSAGLAYPVRGGIPIMLVDEARELE